MASSWLNEHRRIVTSQYGEDGVLAEIFEKIGATNRWFCEFGAWDGEYLSNTFPLLRDHGWNGVMIEGDPVRATALREKRALYPTLHPINAFVSSDGEKSLDRLLGTTDIPVDFDLLSIDIDNDDYFVWEKLVAYTPRVVVLEVNTQFGPDAVRLPTPRYRGFTERSGCSFASAVALGKSKGYELALHTANCIFVRREYAGALDIDPDGWRALFDPSTVHPSLQSRLKTAIGDIARGRVKFPKRAGDS